MKKERMIYNYEIVNKILKLLFIVTIFIRYIYGNDLNNSYCFRNSPIYFLDRNNSVKEMIQSIKFSFTLKNKEEYIDGKLSYSVENNLTYDILNLTCGYAKEKSLIKCNFETDGGGELIFNIKKKLISLVALSTDGEISILPPFDFEKEIFPLALVKEESKPEGFLDTENFKNILYNIDSEDEYYNLLVWIKGKHCSL